MKTNETETIVVRSCANEIEAEIVRGHLENAGIECFIRRFDGGSLLWQEYGPNQDVRVIVFVKDKDEAESILTAMGC